MKQILINDNDLEMDEIDYSVVRVKGIILDSKDDVILVENNNTYQFPGGHKRKEETLEETLEREIREELGMDLKLDVGPFMMITTYDNNYFDSGSKVCNKIYYYIIHTDKEPDRSKMCLDALERETDFNIIKVAYNDLESFLNNCLENGTIESSIGREMLLVCAHYNEMFGGII